MKYAFVLFSCCAAGLAATFELNQRQLDIRSLEILQQRDLINEHHVLLRRTPMTEKRKFGTGTEQHSSAATGKAATGKTSPHQANNNPSPIPAASSGPPTSPKRLPPVQAGFNGRAPFSGWTKRNGRTSFGMVGVASGQSGLVSHRNKASAGVVKQDRPGSGGSAFATGTKTKVVLDMEPGSRAKVSTIQPGGQEQVHRVEQTEPRGRKQRQQFRSSVPGQHMMVQAEIERGEGIVKAKGANE